MLAELAEIGVKLALDHFGTGYSSLGHLNTLPIDTIKVDPTFVNKLSHEPSSHDIVTAIIGLAHALGMSVVSAGVENARQQEEVHQLGSDRSQGFYFARPMLASLIEALIAVGPDLTAAYLPARPEPSGPASQPDGRVRV